MPLNCILQTEPSRGSNWKRGRQPW